MHAFADYLNLDETDEFYLAAFYVLSQNLVHGDALTMLMHDGQPITFAEWGYLGKGNFSGVTSALKLLRKCPLLIVRASLRPPR